ncbi:MAG: DUF151 domain-containing protein [bacterium]|nr:DUF151 domain-containing protein [bacterium]
MQAIEMEIIAVQPDPNNNHPLVWLKDKDQRVFLPIAIGNFEATAIYMELYSEPPSRPITYDLMRSILNGLDVEVDHILINALKNDTFYAEITLVEGEREIKIDSRPSDALALALRVGAPIFVVDSVIQEAGMPVKQDTEEVAPEDRDFDESLMAVLKEDLQDASVPEMAEESKVQEQVITLKAKLQEAVAREAYEEAAKLRDEIGRLEHDINR